MSSEWKLFAVILSRFATTKELCCCFFISFPFYCFAKKKNTTTWNGTESGRKISYHQSRKSSVKAFSSAIITILRYYNLPIDDQHSWALKWAAATITKIKFVQSRTHDAKWTKKKFRKLFQINSFFLFCTSHTYIDMDSCITFQPNSCPSVH